MINEERKIRIMEIIRSDGFVSIKQIMNMFNVSRSSAMRDLDELEKQQLIVRQRGGASLVDSEVLLSQFSELPTRDKQSENKEKKRLICKYAANLVKDGSTIYIDSGTTVLYLLEYLKNRNIIVVTPNTLLLSCIPDDFKGKVILLEGEFYPKSECVAGSSTGMSIMKYHFDYAFLTSNGIDLDNQEVSCYSIAFAENKAMVLQRCDHPILLIDSSKIGIKGVSSWAKSEVFDKIFMERCDIKLDNIVMCE